MWEVLAYIAFAIVISVCLWYLAAALGGDNG